MRGLTLTDVGARRLATAREVVADVLAPLDVAHRPATYRGWWR